MFVHHLARMISRVVVGAGAAIVFLFVATPAYAVCWQCLDNGGVYQCLLVPRESGGSVTCLATSGGCIMGDSCIPYFRENVDADGEIISTLDQVGRALANSTYAEPSELSLVEYLAGLDRDDVVRNCKGLAIARLDQSAKVIPHGMQL